MLKLMMAGFSGGAMSNLTPVLSETRESTEDMVKVSVVVEGDQRRHIPVRIQTNLGGENQASSVFDPEDAGLSREIILTTGKEQTIDVRPLGKEGGAGTVFRVEIDGKRSPLQASPLNVSCKPGQTVRLILEEPVRIAPNAPLSLESADQNKQGASLHIETKGNFILPYAVDVCDKGGKLLHRLPSGPEGQPPKLEETLAAGTYNIHVRPERMHYPILSQCTLSGGSKNVSGPRLQNLEGKADGTVTRSELPVTFRDGQKLTVTVEEGIESYNQVQGAFMGAPTLVLANRPYGHENLDTDDMGAPKFTPNDQDHFPNGIVAMLKLGNGDYEKGITEIALRLAKGVKDVVRQQEDTPTFVPSHEIRREHITLLLRLWGDGKLSPVFVHNSERQLAEYLRGEIDRMMRKPHRVSDALGIQTIAASDQLDGKRNPYHIPGAPEPKEKHMSKLDALRAYGPTYTARWNELEKRLRKDK